MFRLRTPTGGTPTLPGQHVVVQARIRGRWVERPYTIASVPGTDGCYELVVRRERQGLLSRWLFDQLNEGGALRLSPPQGTFCIAPGHAQDVVFLAGGIGITPALAMARSMVMLPGSWALAIDHSVSTEEQGVYRGEFEIFVPRASAHRLPTARNRTRGTDRFCRCGGLCAAISGSDFPCLRKHRLCGRGDGASGELWRSRSTHRDRTFHSLGLTGKDESMVIARSGRVWARVEDEQLLRGEGRFTDDLVIPNAAFGVVLRSPHASADILSIEKNEALRLPGVLAVYTAADLAADGIGGLPCVGAIGNRDGSPAFLPMRPVLAEGVVRHVGEPVAFVVATDRMSAQAAAEAIGVAYRTKPAVVGPEAALEAGTPAVWAEASGNRAFDWQTGREDETNSPLRFGSPRHAAAHRQ